MTPERMRFIIDDCRANHSCPRMSHRAIAAFLDVEPITFRRWMRGQSPIPRPVELLFELHHALPETINRAALQRIMDERDRKEGADDT